MVHSSGDSALCSALHEIDGDVVAAVAERLFRIARIVCSSEGETDEHVLVSVETAWGERKSLASAGTTDPFEQCALTTLAKRLMKIKSNRGSLKSNPLESLTATDDESRFLESFTNLEIGSRLIIALVDVEQIPIAEVSTILGVAPEHVRRKLNRARLQLSELFANLKDAVVNVRDGTPNLGKTSVG